MVRRSMTSSLAALLLAGARADSSCLQTNMEYIGDRVIAPGYVHSPESCQFQCTATYACAYFTWKAHGNATAHQGPGVCLKYNSEATLVPTADNETVSGPVRCPSASTSAPTMPPSPTAVPTVQPSTTAGNDTFVIDGVNCTNATDNSTCKDVHVSGSNTSSFPWWAVLLVALVIIGVGAAVIYGTCDSAKKKKSKKSKKGKVSRSAAAAVEAGEADALVRTEAPPPIVENVIMESPVVMPPAASPVAAMSTASPVYQQPMQPMQQMVYTSTGQVMQVQQQPQMQLQMPVLSGGARAPQFR